MLYRSLELRSVTPETLVPIAADRVIRALAAARAAVTSPKQTLSSFCVRVSGWRVETEVPQLKKYVCLAVPHTSNWDGVMLVLLSQSIGLSLSWMVKASVVRGRFGDALRHFGAIPIDRAASHNVVGAIVEEFRARDEFVLVVPPEGTRGRTEHWRSGFYHIARGAGVPVVPGYLDFSRKVAGFGTPVWLSGDVRADMDRIRAFYNDRRCAALYPGDVGPIRLREE